jgi:hypothetical protein
MKKTNGYVLCQVRTQLFRYISGFKGSLICLQLLLCQLNLFPARMYSYSYYWTLKMEAICFSETSVATQQTTRRHIPEDDTLHKKFKFTHVIKKKKLPITAIKPIRRFLYCEEDRSIRGGGLDGWHPMGLKHCPQPS